MKMVTIEDIQRRIDENRAELEREASLIKWAVRSFMAGVVFGTTIFLAGMAVDFKPVVMGHDPVMAMVGLVLILLVALALLFMDAFRVEPPIRGP